MGTVAKKGGEEEMRGRKSTKRERRTHTHIIDSCEIGGFSIQKLHGKASGILHEKAIGKLHEKVHGKAINKIQKVHPESACEKCIRKVRPERRRRE